MTRRETPVVSVIIPCYNQAPYLAEAVGGVQAQTVADWECIIIDDGSTDNTGEVASSLAASDPRIRLFEQPNGGLSHARNRGIEVARGRYIQFLDADDMLAAEKFELQLRLLSSAEQLALAYCDYCYCGADGEPILDHVCYRPPVLDPEYPLQDIAVGWETKLSIPVHCFLVDVRFFTEHGIRFDESLPNREDWDCWMRIFALSPAVFYLDRKLALYRSLDSSLSRDHVLMRRGFLQAIRKQREIFRGNPEMYAILTKKIAITKRAYRDFAPIRRTWLRIAAGPRALLRNSLPERSRQIIKRLMRRA